MENVTNRVPEKCENDGSIIAQRVLLIRADVRTPRRFSTVNNAAKNIGHNRLG
jgi:hypothetical protein